MKAAVALLVLVAALALVATVQAGFYFTAEDLESDEALWELYGRWAAHHGVVREPGRFPTFKANAHMLHGKQRHAGELMALNVFGDWSFDEVMATLGSPSPPELEELPVIDLDLLAATPTKSTGGLQMLSLMSRGRVAAVDVEGRHAIMTKSAAVGQSGVAGILADAIYVDVQ